MTRSIQWHGVSGPASQCSIVVAASVTRPHNMVVVDQRVGNMRPNGECRVRDVTIVAERFRGMESVPSACSPGVLPCPPKPLSMSPVKVEFSLEESWESDPKTAFEKFVIGVSDDTDVALSHILLFFEKTAERCSQLLDEKEVGCRALLSALLQSEGFLQACRNDSDLEVNAKLAAKFFGVFVNNSTQIGGTWSSLLRDIDGLYNLLHWFRNVRTGARADYVRRGSGEEFSLSELAQRIRDGFIELVDHFAPDWRSPGAESSFEMTGPYISMNGFAGALRTRPPLLSLGSRPPSPLSDSSSSRIPHGEVDIPTRLLTLPIASSRLSSPAHALLSHMSCHASPAHVHSVSHAISRPASATGYQSTPLHSQFNQHTPSFSLNHTQTISPASHSHSHSHAHTLSRPHSPGASSLLLHHSHTITPTHTHQSSSVSTPLPHPLPPSPSPSSSASSPTFFSFPSSDHA